MIFSQNDLHFDALSCLRAASSLNKCDDCIQICPLEAFSIKHDRPVLDKIKCVSCGACVGVCKPEALSLHSFNLPIFIVWASEQKKDQKLACDEIGVCLAAFRADYLATLALRLDAKLSIDLTKCNKCEINKDAKIESLIKTCVVGANELLAGFSKSIAMDSEISDDRRAFLKKLQSSQTMFQNFGGEIKQPAGRMFALAMKEPSEYMAKDVKKIVPSLCTNCNDCVNFCPTNALESADNGQAILHRPSECIECSICEDVCVSRAIYSEKTSLSDWVRTRILISFETKRCSSCGAIFATATNSDKCNGCDVFLEAYPDMFKTAKELDHQ